MTVFAEFDIEYEMTPMGTVIEAEDTGELFAAADEKVTAVEDHLGRAARSDRDDA